MTDDKSLVITWPKKRPLKSYLDEIDKALKAKHIIGFRVPTKPLEVSARCYVVYDGYIRGWSPVIGVKRRSDITDPITHKLMPPGFFILRWPEWNPIQPVPMKGFQGYRYIRIDTLEEKGGSD